MLDPKPHSLICRPYDSKCYNLEAIDITTSASDDDDQCVSYRPRRPNSKAAPRNSDQRIAVMCFPLRLGPFPGQEKNP